MGRIKNRILDGNVCQIMDYNGKMRLLVEGFYNIILPQKDCLATESHAEIEHYADGSTAVRILMLIPWDLSEEQIARLSDYSLVQIEDTLGIDPDSIQSSDWLAGYDDSSWDYLLSKEDQRMVRSGL